MTWVNLGKGQVSTISRRSVKLGFYGAYFFLAVLGLLADFGLFEGEFSTKPFVFYTSLSNMLCSTFMAISLVRYFKHEETELWPACKFVFVVMILLTAIVYNVLLNPFDSIIKYFSSVKSSIYHLILPVMFFLDWIFFYKRGTVKLHYPLVALILPLLYIIFILSRVWIVKIFKIIPVNDLYPYFFLNVDSLGWLGFLKWMAIILVLLLALGYGLYILDRFLKNKAFGGKVKTGVNS